MAERETKATERRASPNPRRGAAGRPARRPPADTSAQQEQIRLLAYEIFQARRSSGMPGDAVSDWLEAERRLSETKQSGPRRKPSGK